MLCLQICAFGAAQATNHACGGRALRCLSDKAAEISSAACRKEVFYFQKMEVRQRGTLLPLELQYGRGACASSAAPSFVPSTPDWLAFNWDEHQLVLVIWAAHGGALQLARAPLQLSPHCHSGSFFCLSNIARKSPALLCRCLTSATTSFWRRHAAMTSIDSARRSSQVLLTHHCCIRAVDMQTLAWVGSDNASPAYMLSGNEGASVGEQVTGTHSDENSDGNPYENPCRRGACARLPAQEPRQAVRQLPPGGAAPQHHAGAGAAASFCSDTCNRTEHACLASQIAAGASKHAAQVGSTSRLPGELERGIC